MSRLVLLPRLIEPLELDAPVAWYEDDAEPGARELEDAGFFVPRYLGHAENVRLAARMPNLRVLQLLTVGYDYAIGLVPPGVTLCNAQGVHEASTAELALGLTIASMRRIDGAARAMESGTWDHRRGTSLQRARVVVIGAGPVGRLIAERFAPLAGEVTVVARTAREGVRGIAELASLLPTADVVVLAVALTAETTGMVDAAFLAAMRDGALLVNVSRGRVVDTEALVREVGRLKCALDVTDPEPLPPDHPLWRSPNALITPHVGGNTDAFPHLARELIVRQVRAWMSGQPLENVISVGV